MYNLKPNIMKALKATLLLVIFCLTFSGQSSDVVTSKKGDTFKTNKVEFKNIVLNKDKIKAPSEA
jgi:hypothetical protein